MSTKSKSIETKTDFNQDERLKKVSKLRLLVKANIRSFFIPIFLIISKVSTLLKERDFTGEKYRFLIFTYISI